MTALSAVISNAIHLYYIGWVNDGWAPGSSSQFVKSIILTWGQENDPKVLLFYVTITYLFWWFIGMIRGKGIKKTIKLLVTTPIWVAKSLIRAKLTALPMILTGLAVSFIIGFNYLTVATVPTMSLMVLTIIISQKESILLTALRLGIRDVSSLIKRGEKVDLPDPALPTLMLLGSCIGFGYLTFYNPSPTAIRVFTALALASVASMFILGRRNQRTGVMMVLLLLITASAIVLPSVMADDGGIKENGGWDALLNNKWLMEELVKKGLPVSTVSALSAAFLAGMRSTQLSKVKLLNDDYVNIKYNDANPYDRDLSEWVYEKNPNGQYVDKSGEHYTRYLPQGIPDYLIGMKDSETYSLDVRMFTKDPVIDTELNQKIVDSIWNGLDGSTSDKLNPEKWKNLSGDEKGELMKNLSDLIKKELGLEMNLKFENNSTDPTLGGKQIPSKDGAPATVIVYTSSDIFKDPQKAVRTLVHEIRHVYQDAQAKADGNDFQKICSYNINHYESSEDDYVRYGEQFIERDARAFGHEISNKLFDNLNNLWGNK